MECAFTYPVMDECGMFMMYCMQCFYIHFSCFVVRGCAVSRRYIRECDVARLTAMLVWRMIVVW